MFYDNLFRQRYRPDWVDLSLAVTNFDAARRPLKCTVRLFQAQGWNRRPKEILSVDYNLRRRISSVRFENLPVGVPLYLHVSGDVLLADADEDGLASGVEQFLGKRAQVRLTARSTEAQVSPHRQQNATDSWASGPRRFRKMHSLASRQSLVQLAHYSAALSSLEARAKDALQALDSHLSGATDVSIDLEKLREALYELNDELEELRSSKLDAVDVDGLESGAQAATSQKRELLQSSKALAKRLRDALTNPVFPPELDSDEDAPARVAQDQPELPPTKKKATGAATQEAAEAAKARNVPGHRAAPVRCPSARFPAPLTEDGDSEGASAPASESGDEGITMADGGGSSTGGNTGSSHGTAPKVFSKQHSVASQQRLNRLSDIRERVDAIASEYEGLTAMLETLDPATEDGTTGRAKVKDNCAMLYGSLEKLQFKEIDGVLVGDLHSGQDEARAMRKQLTRDVNELTEKVKATVLQIKQGQ